MLFRCLSGVYSPSQNIHEGVKDKNSRKLISFHDAFLYSAIKNDKF